MSGMTNLDELLRSISPEIIEGNYVFCTLNGTLSEFVALEPIASFREKEGLTLVLEEHTAIAANINFDAVFGLITLSVHSSLEAVGLTAAFANKLSAHGISANVIGGYYHDHIFVQKSQVQKAMNALNELSSS